MKNRNASIVRNPEIKRDIILFSIVLLAGTSIGFFISIPTGIAVFLSVFPVSVLHFIITDKRYRNIAGLSREIDKVLHSREAVEFSVYKEGELSILQNEIQKMVIRLREQRDALSKDKIYLADSLADISHQLKTPLTSINLLLTFLEKEDITAEQKAGYIRDLKGLMKRIDWLISALLRLSKLDAGTVSFKEERIDLREAVRLSLETVLIPMELKGQLLKMNIEENAYIIGDMSWTVEAILNVIKNCMEHTPNQGTIKISGICNSIFTELVVEDNGTGISEEDLPRIFERFYKGKNSSSQSIGIGLALARQIIVRQNGTIKAENKKEGGVRFVIRFYFK
ncbi:signal transduction histidine kinase [Anaerotaenia torta]|uniref:sensor histidine kinase n=1 Tax=Anaerotaenia torta TaxID=433293 RepID=UPI003D1B7842